VQILPKSFSFPAPTGGAEKDLGTITGYGKLRIHLFNLTIDEMQEVAQQKLGE